MEGVVFIPTPEHAKKKNAVAATMAIDIIQKVIPTGSVGSKLAARANVGNPVNKETGIRYFKKFLNDI